MNTSYSAPQRTTAESREPRRSVFAPPQPSIVRAAFSEFVASATRNSTRRQSADEVAAALWPADRSVLAVLRAVAAPSTSADHPALLATAAGEFIRSLRPSAAARLFSTGIEVSLIGADTITYPARDPAVPAPLAWVGEGDPIPVRQAGIGAVVLGPTRLLASIIVLSGSLARRSAALPIFERLVRDEASASLDAALFSAAAASDLAEAGLLAGVAATPPYPMPPTETLGVLSAIVAGAPGASGEVVFVAAPDVYAAIRLAVPDLAFPLLPSAALPAGRVIAVDPTALIVGYGASDLEVSREGLLHMDNEPEQIVPEGGPASAPTRGLWQTDSLGVRITVNISWRLRAPGLVAFSDGVVYA